MIYQDYLKHYEEYQSANSFLKEPKELYEPIEYILGLGGKRIRPVLVLSACDLFHGNLKTATKAAHAVEVFHNFTLMHDDIMDEAPLRRGAPSVPNKYGSNLAVLSGDTMLIKAYQEIEKLPQDVAIKSFSLFNKTALEVCEGQMLDMSFEEKIEVEELEYLEMIRLKTAVLMACSLKLGGICANVNEQQLELLYKLGLNMGMAFQIQDDLLDSFGTDDFGKTIGGDILNDKKTILHIHTLQKASKEDRELLLSFEGSTSNKDEKVIGVKKLFLKYEAEKYAKDLMNTYFKNAEENLSAIQCEEGKKDFLKSLNELLVKRAV